MALLRKGLQGEPVRILQTRLELTPDGIFAQTTEDALRSYQEKARLAVDGIAGPDTFAHMGLYELVLLRRGSRGPTVKKLQEALGTGADGIFGGGTEKLVMDFQRANGLDPDGMAGPATLAKLELFKEVTEATVARAQLPSNYVEPTKPKGLEIDDVTIAAGKKAVVVAQEASKKKGIWGTVKGWFS